MGNPVLLFLHAFPFSAEMWKDQLNFFSEKFYCIAPDLPGFGESNLPGFAFTFEFYVDSILDYLKVSKIENAIWCGLSMGGYIALRMYERAPEQCRALILCDTKSSADSHRAKLKRWDSIKMLQRNRAEFIDSQWQALASETSKKNSVFKNHFERLLTGVSNEGIAAGLVAMASRTDSTESLSKICVPTFLVVGAEDQVTPVSDSEAISNAIVGSQIKVLDQIGHLSNLENPQIFNEHLNQILLSLS